MACLLIKPILWYYSATQDYARGTYMILFIVIPTIRQILIPLSIESSSFYYHLILYR